MDKKSFFGCFTDSVARNIPRKVGVRVYISYNSYGPQCIQGKIMFVKEDVHGTLLMVKNDNFGNNLSSLPGWATVPIWISKCYGQSGILATWRDDADYMAALTQMEREVSCAMAL